MAQASVYRQTIQALWRPETETVITPVPVYIPTISRNVNAGGCYDGRRRGWEVRAYRIAVDRLSGEAVWRRLKFPGMAVRDCRFTHRKDGGRDCLVTDSSMFSYGIGVL